MEFEDSRNALYVDPNAYIQRYNKKEQQPKKVVFQEPYECMPSYYIDNNFKKGDCSCISKPKKHDDSCAKHTTQPGFDFKNMLPLLSLFNKGGNADLSSVINVFNNSNGNNQNPINMITSLLSNSGGLGNMLKLFNGTTKNNKKELQTTDFEIKNYTRVE